METTVVIGCPACGRRYRFDTRRFGTSGVRVRCRSCETIMQVRIRPEMLEPARTASAAGPAGSEPAEEESPAPVDPPEPAEAQDATPVFDTPESVLKEGGIPAGPAESIQEEVPTRAEPASRQAPPAAVVADRDEDRRRLLEELLKNHGYMVTSVENGVEARRAIAATRPRLVFLNTFLPSVLGVTLCAEIKRHPELSMTAVVLVGSQYRRDRFVRNPQGLYGADAFLDCSGPDEEVLRKTGEVLARLQAAAERAPRAAEDDVSELRRLARIIAGDIILYNPKIADAEIAAGRFFETFAEEIREGESLVARRFPTLGNGRSILHDTLREAVAQHGSAAGTSSPVKVSGY